MTTLKLYITSHDNVFHCEIREDNEFYRHIKIRDFNDNLPLEMNTYKFTTELSHRLNVSENILEVPVRMTCLLKEYSYSLPSL